MSKRTFVYCDRCGVQIGQHSPSSPYQHRISLQVDRRMDGAGSMENIYEARHLCGGCALPLLQSTLKDVLTRSEAKAWIKKHIDKPTKRPSTWGRR